MADQKIFIYDLETSHNIAAIFQLAHNDYVDHHNLLAERYIISASYRWFGENKTHSISVLDDPKRFAKDPNDDRYVVEKLHELMSQADVLVAHNGDQFDNKYVRTRALYHGLKALPPIASIDTCKVARNKFLFNSNKLDYVAKFLKIGGKKHTSAGLWLRALRGDAEAIKEMVKYNKVDVEILEKVYVALRPYMDSHPSRELFGLDGCPRCGSKKLQSRGYHRAISRVYRRFQCTACGGWTKAAVNEKDVKTSQRLI